MAEQVKSLPLRPRRSSCYPEDREPALDWVIAENSKSSWRAVADAFASAPFRAVRPIGRYWEGVTTGFGYRPPSRRYRRRQGPARELLVCLEDRGSSSQPWISIQTTARGEDDRRNADEGRHVQVVTYDHSPEQTAREKLADAVPLPIDWSRLRLAPERNRPYVLRAEIERLKAEATEEIEAAPRAEVLIPVDEVGVAFTVIRLGVLTAASATLPDRTITAWGRFDCRDLRLRSISEITPWSSAADDSQQR